MFDLIMETKAQKGHTSPKVEGETIARHGKAKLAVQLTHISAPGGQERINRAINLLLAAAQHADGGENMNSEGVITLPKQGGGHSRTTSAGNASGNASGDAEGSVWQTIYGKPMGKRHGKRYGKRRGNPKGNPHGNLGRKKL